MAEDLAADPAASGRLLETFLDLVRIDSPSTEEAAVAAFCAKVLARAGCAVRFDASAATTGSNTGNLIAELPGTLPRTVVLCAHMDTVEPGRGVEPVLSDGWVFSAGDTVLGADDKAGLAAAIECVQRLAESGRPHATVRCIFTVQEEVGLVGAKELDADTVAADLCLVLDADGAPGGIITAAPTHYTFTARFEGRAAHAGVAPEQGVSAIGMASRAIARLPIGRVDDVTTANVGTVSGGTATNVIAARTEITGECRSLDRPRVEALKTEMDEAMRAEAESAGGSVAIDWQLAYPGFEVESDSPAVATLQAACERVGLIPKLMHTGGGSDANVIAALGIPTVVASCGMQCVHGVNEQIAVADLEALTALCVAVCEQSAESEASGS